MNRKTLLTAAACCAAVITGAIVPDRLNAAEKPDFKTIAERVIGQCVNVKEGDRVIVAGDVRDIELIEEMVLSSSKRGAESMQLVNREKATRRYFDEVPKKYDALPQSLLLKLVETQTVAVNIFGQEFPALLGDVDPERITAISKRNNDVFTAVRKRGVRYVELGNGLYPTEATAKRYGITKDQLADIFWSGINVDYNKLQATAATLCSILSRGKEVRVTHPNGTDLKLRIEGRPVFANDGVISPEDVAKGGPATQAFLPAGEVYLVPVPGTAEGKIVFDSLQYDAGEIMDATFIVKAGKLTSHSAKPGPGFDRWEALYKAAPAGKDNFAALDIGINENVKVPPGSKLTTWVPAGSVSLGFGGDTWAGGSNDMGWNAGGAINGCTVTVDGKTIVEKGVLKVR